MRKMKNKIQFEKIAGLFFLFELVTLDEIPINDARRILDALFDLKLVYVVIILLLYSTTLLVKRGMYSLAQYCVLLLLDFPSEIVIYYSLLVYVLLLYFSGC